MKYEYTIELGDPSNDGHGRAEYIIVETSHSREEILKSEKKFAQISGLSLRSPCNLLAEYEENSISQEKLKKMVSCGIQLSSKFLEETEDLQHIDSESAIHLFMAIVRVYLPELEYSIRPFPPKLADFGYGLYY